MLRIEAQDGEVRSTSQVGGSTPRIAATAGEAALWDGSIAAVGMAANPFGAHRVGRYATGLDVIGTCRCG
jgi:hypothetical protein